MAYGESTIRPYAAVEIRQGAVSSSASYCLAHSLTPSSFLPVEVRFSMSSFHSLPPHLASHHNFSPQPCFIVSPAYQDETIYGVVPRWNGPPFFIAITRLDRELAYDDNIQSHSQLHS
jgi:hypothetical protein